MWVGEGVDLELLTIVSAAFLDRILGLGLSALGTGGGRAATWGDAASLESWVPVGRTSGVASDDDSG